MSVNLPQQTISTNAGIPIVDGGALVYELSTVGGTIEKGTVSVTTTITGTSVSLSGSPSLVSVQKGNIIQQGANIAIISAIDDVTKTLTLVAPGLATSGAATISLDSFGPVAGTGVYLITPNTFLLATRKGTQLVFNNQPPQVSVDNFTIEFNGGGQLTNSNSFFGSFTDDVAYVTAKGAAAVAGDSYFNTVFLELRFFNGSIWQGPMPSGTIAPTGRITAPAGWLMCNGVIYDSVSDPRYAALYSAIGISFGGTGPSHFYVPDLRGRFLRGADNLSLRDPDILNRIAMNPGGNTQGGIGSIEGAATAVNGLTTAASSVSGSVGGPSDGTHNHTYETRNGLDSPNDRLAGGNSGHANQYFVTEANTGGGHAHAFSLAAAAQGLTGDSETRPINAYVNYIIKI